MTNDGWQPKIVRQCPICKQQFADDISVCPQDASILVPVEVENLIGSLFVGKYRILSEIGRGGMSVVYKGKHELMDHLVAIKTLLHELLLDPVCIRRFQEEAKAASLLHHPNVISVHDFGVSPNNQVYLVLDYLEGVSLAQRIRQKGRLSPSEALPIFVQACDALEHAHQKGVLHRDIKPSNLMLIEHKGQKDFVMVVDFGMAKLTPKSGKEAHNLTHTGEIVGNPMFMSPEQCIGKKIDARSDVYSLGGVLYEALTGTPPFMGDTIIDTIHMHIAQKPVPPSEARSGLSVPQDLEDIVLTCLQKDPDYRFQTMKEFRDALYAFANKENIAVPAPAAEAPQYTSSPDLKEASAPPSPEDNVPEPTMRLPLGPESGKGDNKLFIASIALGTSAIFAGLIYFLTSPQRLANPQTANGSIVYYRAPEHSHDPSQIFLWSKEGRMLKLQGANLRKYCSSDVDLTNGARWKVTYHLNKDEDKVIDAAVFDYGFNQDIKDADLLIRRHIADIARGRLSEAYDDLDPALKSKESFELFSNFWKDKSQHLSSDTSSSSPGAIKFVTIQPERMRAYIDLSCFAPDQNGYLAYELAESNGQWLISNKQLISQEQWNEK